MDGFGSAYAVYSSIIGDQVKFIPGIFDQDPPDVSGKHVIIVDFSYSADRLREMAKVAESVTILDHHESAQKEIQPLLDEGIIKGEFDLNKSGAMLSWNYFHPGETVPDLFRYISDGDLLKFELPNSKEINAGISTHPYDFEVWQELVERDIQLLIPDGLVVLRKLGRDLKQMLSVATRSLNIAGHLVPAANVPYFMASESCEYLAMGAKFAATYYDTETTRIFSLRSNKSEFNVSLIAKQYGGGGSKRSAGFRIPLNRVLDLEPNRCPACQELHAEDDVYCSESCKLSVGSS